MSNDILRGFEGSEFSEPVRNDRQTLIDVLSRTCQARHNSIATVHREAVQTLARLYIPHISTSPSPDQFRDVADFLLHWARIADRVLKIVGEEANSNTSEVLDMSDFDGSFIGAIEGNATFQLEKCAQAVEAEEEYGDYYADDSSYEERAES
jgi:hypothetical protein